MEESKSSFENLYKITKEIFDKKAEKAKVSDRHVSSLCYLMKSTCAGQQTEQFTKAQAL